MVTTKIKTSLFIRRGASAKQARHSTDCFENIPEKPQASKKQQQSTTNKLRALISRKDEKYTKLCKTVDKDTEMFILHNGRLV